MSSDLASLENAELKEAFDAFDKVSGTRSDRLAGIGIIVAVVPGCLGAWLCNIIIISLPLLYYYSRTAAERFLQRSCWES